MFVRESAFLFGREVLKSMTNKKEHWEIGYSLNISKIIKTSHFENL
jgi:hypothetical protein